MNFSHLIINSNKWFSAVSDYSFQLAKYLHAQQRNNVLYAAHELSPTRKKCEKFGIRTVVLPLLPQSFFTFFWTWTELTKLLRNRSNAKPLCVWVFEGREHTVCILHKYVHSKLWKMAKLIRIRGQTAKVSANPISQWIYTVATDQIVFASEVIQKNMPFSFDDKRGRVFLYCAGVIQDNSDFEGNKKWISEKNFLDGVPAIHLNATMFLVVGRYDPVKGHELLLRAFAGARFSNTADNPVQLVFVGESQNVSAIDLYKLAGQLFKGGVVVAEQKKGEGRYFIRSADGRKCIFIFDERYADVSSLMQAAHFGIIPSLASEVICRVAVEFLQVGTPLLASTVGALPEVISPECGIFFTPGNQAELQSGLEKASQLNPTSLEYKKAKQCALDTGKKFELNQYLNLLKWASENE